MKGEENVNWLEHCTTGKTEWNNIEGISHEDMV